MSAIIYHPIGIVKCSITKPLHPEVIRAIESQLVLEPRFAPAVAILEVGQHLLVVVTLTRVVALSDSTITVVGLDAIDGSPILDIKPYKPIYDAPPVHPRD